MTENDELIAACRRAAKAILAADALLIGRKDGGCDGPSRLMITGPSLS